eukprot:5571105-Amphidinium_carterae.1
MQRIQACESDARASTPPNTKKKGTTKTATCTDQNWFSVFGHRFQFRLNSLGMHPVLVLGDFNLDASDAWFHQLLGHSVGLPCYFAPSAVGPQAFPLTDSIDELSLESGCDE